jgi:hypothetical protein
MSTERRLIIRIHDGYVICEGTALDALGKGFIPHHFQCLHAELESWKADPVNFVPPKVGDHIEFHDDGKRVHVPRPAGQ